MPQFFNSGPKKAGWGAIAVTLIAGFEGLYTYAYKDIVGVTTVCYGVTNADRPVKMGDHYTKEECQQMLLEDLPKYDSCVLKAIHVPMPDHRHAAIDSFTFNVGCAALAKSSVARKLNAGDVKGGCDALLLYNKAGGRVVKGLVNRREAERKECLRND